jgi:hypothetical protein
MNKICQTFKTQTFQTYFKNSASYECDAAINYYTYKIIYENKIIIINIERRVYIERERENKREVK